MEIVGAAFQAFSAGGIEAALPFFAPDCAWYPTDRWLDEWAYRGHDGMHRLNAAFLENFDGYGYEVHEIRDAGDRVVALVSMFGQIKNSKQSISQPLGLVVSDFRSGTLGQIRVFASWQEALSAVGLEQ